MRHYLFVGEKPGPTAPRLRYGFCGLEGRDTTHTRERTMNLKRVEDNAVPGGVRGRMMEESLRRAARSPRPLRKSLFKAALGEACLAARQEAEEAWEAGGTVAEALEKASRLLSALAVHAERAARGDGRA